MIKSLSAAIAGLLSLTASAALAAQDPTFNGTIMRAECGLRTITLCADGYCVLVVGPCIGERCGMFDVMVDRGMYELGEASKPLVYTGISPAEIGKPLWLKFKVDVGELAGNAMVSMKPDPLQGYVTTATIFVEDGPLKGNNHSTLIENFECGRFPRDAE